MSASHNHNNFFSIYLYRFSFFFFYCVCFSIHTRQPVHCVRCVQSTRHWSAFVRRKEDSNTSQASIFHNHFSRFYLPNFSWLLFAGNRRHRCRRSSFSFFCRSVACAHREPLEHWFLRSIFLLCAQRAKFPSRRNKQQRQHEPNK